MVQMDLRIPDYTAFEASTQCACGDLVLKHDKKIPIGLWPIVIVKRVFPGRDNRIRTVELKTKDAILNRPVVNIRLLGECGN